MAKGDMSLFGIDQIDQNPREAWKPQQFRPAQHLQQPTGRSGGVPRPFSVALRLAAPPHRASGDDSEQRGLIFECGQSSLQAAARGHQGAARLIRRRRNQRLGGCWRSTASTPVSGASWARPARCGWSRPALPLAAAVVGEAPAFQPAVRMPSAAGPAAALGLKTRSALMSGDMDLATTTAAGAAQNAAAQAQSLAAAAAAPAAAAQSGAYGWGAMNIASQSLPAVPARSSSAGRPARPVAAIFQPGHRPAAGRSASAPRPKKRGRPPKAGGGFICPRCNVGVGSKDVLNNSHYKEHEITKPDGSTEKRRLCVAMDAKVRSLLAHFLLTLCSLYARVLLAFCSPFTHILIGHKSPQGHGEDAATACWAGHTGVHTAGARGRY